MDKITSEAFYNAWIEIVTNKKNQLTGIWRENKLFTRYIKGDDQSIMKAIADKLDLLCYHSDYYCIDTVLYKEEDLVPKRPEGSYWLRDIRVAFEHENNFNAGLYQEVSHLLLINCDLRVLVTYPNGDIKYQLEYLHSIIKGSRQSSIISDEKNFLLIFGYQNDFRWQGYVFEEDTWVKL